jgi:hypothetical protein
MPQNATYFISRLNKVGELSLQDVIDALDNRIVVTSRECSYTITNFTTQYLEGEKYYSGLFTKFKTEGLVKVLDLKSREPVDIIEPDLIIASSQFLFLPEFACFVYQRIWNQIEMATFSARMRDIILKSKDYFLVDCKLEPVSDIKNFLEKIKRISIINEIKATVNPPNPLFGHLWESLEKYLKKRNLDELKLNEKAKNKPINSNLLNLLQSIDENIDLKTIDPNSIEIGDAAILMSIDGYGSATIEGKSGKRFISIRTNQKSVQFHFPVGENLDDLHKEAKKILDNINDQRYMSHD